MDLFILLTYSKVDRYGVQASDRLTILHAGLKIRQQVHNPDCLRIARLPFTANNIRIADMPLCIYLKLYHYAFTVFPFLFPQCTLDSFL